MFTFKLVAKALLIIWPFLRSAIFRGRTVSEVLRENWHMNAMFTLVITLIIFLWYTTHAVMDARSEITRLETLINQQPVCIAPEVVDDRRRMLIDLLK